MYYAETPDSAHDIHELTVTLLGKPFKFLTDSGVFSKKQIDYGSQVLLNTVSVEKGKSLLDLGCGYGPIGISLAKAKGVQVTMVDINRRAIDLARKNAIENQAIVTIFQSNVYDNVTGLFDYIVTNPPIRAGKQVVNEMINGSFNHLRCGGSLTIVIQKKQGAPSAKNQMEEVFGNVDTLKRDKGYYILQSKKIE